MASAGERTAMLKYQCLAANKWSRYPATQDVNMDCNSINNILSETFCDGTYIGPGGSFDISSGERIVIKSTDSIDISSGTNITVTAGASGGDINMSAPAGNFSASCDNDISLTAAAVTLNSNSITTTGRIYQELDPMSSYEAVNGFYGLAKDAYIGLNPYSSGEKALSTTNISSWTLRTIPVDLLSMQVSSVCWSPNLGLFVAVVADLIATGWLITGVLWFNFWA